MTTAESFVAQSTPSVADPDLLSRLIQFNNDYVAVLDRGSLLDWPHFFIDDCLYRITSRENLQLNLPVGLVYAEGKAMLSDRALAIAKTQMYAPRYLLHLLSLPRITQVSPGSIHCETNFLLIQTLIEGPSTLHLAGTYIDRFVDKTSQLLLQSRDVIYDTDLLANDLVYPV